jgi:hypothetical protein
MRPRILLMSALLLAPAACGGSSSETPWPAEPQGAALGPADESAPAGSSTATPEVGEGAASEPPDAGR